MICKCCGEVKPDWGNSRYCRDCWMDLMNEHASDYKEDYGECENEDGDDE